MANDTHGRPSLQLLGRPGGLAAAGSGTGAARIVGVSRLRCFGHGNQSPQQALSWRFWTKPKANLAQLLQLSDDYDILFLQGGARLQFSMVPMNILRGTGKPADFILTGSWGKKARDEAAREGEVHIAWDGKDSQLRSHSGELGTAAQRRRGDGPHHVERDDRGRAVRHRTGGRRRAVGLRRLVRFPLASAAIDRYGIIYACAQKNVGPAGVTVVVIRKDLLERSQDSLPGYLNYAQHAKNNSMFNTPPTFAVYMVGLVAKWLLDDIGGLEAMAQINRSKAQLLYDVIDESGEFYRGHARPDCRSVMNVTFRLPTEELEAEFVAEADAARTDHAQGPPQRRRHPGIDLQRDAGRRCREAAGLHA